MADIKPIGVPFDRTFRNDLNENLDALNNEALGAKSKAENVQTQLNTIIIESGTSDAEVLQARGGQPVLNERLNAFDSDIENLSDKFMYDLFVKNGVSMDGTADAADKVSQIITALPNNVKHIEFPKVPLLLKKPISINKDDVTVDLSKAGIVWAGDESLNNGSTRSIGFVNVKGTRTTVVKSIISFNLYDKTNGYPQAVLTVNNVTDIAVGDAVILTISSGAYSDTALTPKVDIMTTISKIDSVNSKVYLKYNNPFRFPSSGFTGTLTKVIPRKNVEVVYGNVVDAVPVAGGLNPNSPYPTREHMISGVSLEYTVDCTVRDIKAKGTKFPVVLARYTISTHIEAVELESPAIVGGGEGYLAQINMSTLATVKGCRSNAARHLIDFTGSAFCVVEDCHGYDMYSNAFQLHGAYEHDITYKRCSGNWGNASGTEFGNANMNIHFEDFRGKLLGGGYCVNLTFKNSDVTFTRGYSTVLAENSKIEIYNLNDIEFKKRGEPITTQWLMRDCDITFDSSKNTANIRGCDSFIITGRSKVRFIGDNPDMSLGGKEAFVYDTKYFRIDGAEIDTAKFSLRGSMKEARYERNTCIAKASGFMFSSRDLVNSNATIYAVDNTFEKSAAFAVGAIYAPSTNNVTTSNVDAIIRGNISKGADFTIRKVGTGKVQFTHNTIDATVQKDVLNIDERNLINGVLT